MVADRADHRIVPHGIVHRKLLVRTVGAWRSSSAFVDRQRLVVSAVRGVGLGCAGLIVVGAGGLGQVLRLDRRALGVRASLTSLDGTLLGFGFRALCFCRTLVCACANALSLDRAASGLLAKLAGLLARWRSSRRRRAARAASATRSTTTMATMIIATTAALLIMNLPLVSLQDAYPLGLGGNAVCDRARKTVVPDVTHLGELCAGMARLRRSIR